jgi:opacity protein-like surface antigen
MASLISRARATALTATLGAMCVSAATAADMPFLSPLPAPPPVDQPVEFGTGWYLRGDIGYSNMSIPAVVADFVSNLGRTGAVSGGLGFGYQYNNWLRTDLEIDHAAFKLGATHAPEWCPSGTVLYYPAGSTNVASPGTGTPAGFMYDPSETCTPVINASLNRTTPMFNAYIDLGNWSGFTPYVGAGIGFSYLHSNASVNYVNTANGQPWAPNLGQAGVPLQWVQNPFIAVPIVPTPATAPTQTLVPNVVTAPRALAWSQLNPNQYVSKGSWKFSWNIMAGVSYDVSQNIKVDVHYRYLDIGSYTSLPSVLTLAPGVTKELVSQEIRLGVRMTSD